MKNGVINVASKVADVSEATLYNLQYLWTVLVIAVKLFNFDENRIIEINDEDVLCTTTKSKFSYSVAFWTKTCSVVQYRLLHPFEYSGPAIYLCC